MRLCWPYEKLSGPPRGSGECISRRILGDESGLVVKTGDDGTLKLVEMTESTGLKDEELGDLELPFRLPLEWWVEREVLEGREDWRRSLEKVERV